jgi:transposase InsO family protein
MSEVDSRADLDGFVAGLKRVSRAAGAPSYAQLESISGKLLRQQPPGGVRFVALAPSTTSEILGGRRKQAPKWQWVLTFLTALQAAAREGGLDAAVVGTIEEWKRKHEAVLAAQEAPPHPLPDGPRQHGARRRTSVIDPAPPRPTAAGDGDGSPDALLGAFLALVRQAGVPQGRHGAQDATPEWVETYMTLEAGAELVLTYETQFVPGLLQTEAYARAVVARRLAGVTAEEATSLVARRMQRQSPRRHQKPRRLWAVIRETALRSAQFDPSIMRAQVEHLIDMIGDPHTVLQVVSSRAVSNQALGKQDLSEPMTIFSFPEPFFGDVVCLEQGDDARFLHERKDTEHYSQLFENLTLKAATRDSTRRILARIRDEI